MLVYDGQGFWLCHKRLVQGAFCLELSGHNTRIRDLAAQQLQVLLWNSDPGKMHSRRFSSDCQNFIEILEKNSGHGQLSLL